MAFKYEIDEKRSQQERLALLERREKFLGEAIMGGNAELATILDRISLEPCAQARPEYVEQITVILHALKQIDDANKKLSRIRDDLERRGFKTGSLPPALYTAGGRWNDPCGGHVVGYQRYITEHFPELATVAGQSNKNRAA
jgi:hypothetical protein